MSGLPRAQLPRLGALARWRAELAAGRRHNTFADFDALAAAAASEATALELERAGDRRAAQWFMDRAFFRLNGIQPGPGEREAGLRLLGRKSA